jgi:hypothetical protein
LTDYEEESKPEEADGGEADEVHVVVPVAEGVDHVDHNGRRLTTLLLHTNYEL